MNLENNWQFLSKKAKMLRFFSKAHVKSVMPIWEELTIFESFNPRKQDSSIYIFVFLSFTVFTVEVPTYFVTFICKNLFSEWNYFSI